VCSETDLDLSDGDALLHTDFNTLNILFPDRVWIIDWAWPTRGASFIDVACFLVRAMAGGQRRRPSQGARRAMFRLAAGDNCNDRHVRSG